MPNPHLDGGRPWWPSTYGYSGPSQPVATGTPNFGGQGTGGDNQPPPYNDPREQGIMAAATANMPIDVPPVTQTQTGGAFGGYETPQQQLAASLMDAGAVTSGALSGPALWTQAPPDADPMIQQAIDENENVYYSSFPEGAQAHSPTGLIEVTGPGQLSENGEVIEGFVDHQIFNPYSSDSFDDWWYGDEGTPWGQEWYDYPTGDEETTMAHHPHWRARPKTTEMLSMGEMQPIYGPEFSEELMASPLFMAGLESTTGIPYPGLPKFGTIEMGEV